MNDNQQESKFRMDQHLWDIAEGLLSPDMNVRERSLDQLIETEEYYKSPLIASLLVSRISEPDLEFRFHLIQLLGSLLDIETSDQYFTDQALVYAQDTLNQIGENQLVKLLEVSDKYLTSVKAISAILHMISYAGNSLGGIVNDRKQPVSLRQQAIFYCGEVGFLSSRPTLQNLIQRVEKARNRSGDVSERKKSRDEELLYPYAISALEKLKP
jgi:hypothetical protein